jgi:hypothetical protein
MQGTLWETLLGRKELQKQNEQGHSVPFFLSYAREAIKQYLPPGKFGFSYLKNPF